MNVNYITSQWRLDGNWIQVVGRGWLHESEVKWMLGSTGKLIKVPSTSLITTGRIFRKHNICRGN